MKRSPLSFLALGALFFLALCPPTYADDAWKKIKETKLFNGEVLSEYRLKNQLRVLFMPRHQAKVLTYQTWFQVGSVDEKLDPKLKKTGLAHLFEHMMFRGTDKYADGKFDEISSRIGSDKQNATTYYYRTNYFQNVPSNRLETIIELESDRMRSLKILPEVLEKEKGAVVGELRRALDNPNRAAWDELCQLAYETAPYRYTVLGSEEEIKGFTLEEANYFYRTFYAPNNGTIIVVGDTTEEELLKLIEKYYGDMVPQTIPRPAMPEEPKQKKERFSEKTHAQATSEILLLGYKIPGVSHADSVPLSLLGVHLSAGMEARLRKLLVDKGIAVAAGGEPSSQPDLFEFSVHLAEKHRAEEALGIIDREIANLRQTAISKDSFGRALNQELLNLYKSFSENSALGNNLGEYLMLSGNYLRGLEIVEEYKKISPADLLRVAKLYLNKENRSVVIIRPPKKEKS